MQTLLPAFTGLVLVIFGFAKEIAFGYWTGGVILVISLVVYLIQSASGDAKRFKGESWIKQFPNAQYAFCNGKVGIAVDSKASMLHLMEKDSAKLMRFRMFVRGDLIYKPAAQTYITEEVHLLRWMLALQVMRSEPLIN